ncbi:lysylphosphatidylglycerol synthase transmembrane domain-containing protein [Mycolicibacterium goodii]|uniref:Flippase-like domain-containing protein n=1 Tax=Mycolicibacterium goodii TaxID=134601 RepID=A0ABS6HN71_MYCGD|nr:lysylphosphatidylglycerol synthase transmembrane domain-containing protein [Mycolicibacterium goodii]OKH71317.1 membrane protein [Mycobacterium sp. SWH-M5]MBU8808803.1 flippase-like domain-containing protein [Mycolicibacterium goodii]MBU8824070.1 flippase-like domain-containing protein [Mycolicibacterium goodii]MBU8832907.1 flippase-like domain-containing protein [Mycolicibacterium goodii]MBU8840356.1 flippase-like domain-containing protein [Mycolicibacterium goodii]
MRVDGRDIVVTGKLLQPMSRRTNDILRLALAALFLATVIASSLITRYEWVALERSISEVVGVLTPTQSNLVYLAYGIAIVALPFVILVSLIFSRQWKLLGAYAAAGLITMLSLSITGNGIAAPQWHFDLGDRLDSQLSQFLDDPRWIGMLAAVLTVSGPWLPRRLRRWWWALLLAFVPIHLVVSAVVPARSLLGLAAGWFVGALVVWVVGTPALEVPLDGAVRALTRRGFQVSSFTVVRPAGAGPLLLDAASQDPDSTAVVELYGPNQRSGGAFRQLWRKVRFRSDETAPLQTSMRRAVEHRALMAIAIGDLGLSSTSTMSVAALDRGWTLYAHNRKRGTPLDQCTDEATVGRVWNALRMLHDHQISHGDLRSKEITVEDGAVLFGGFGNAEYGATDAQLQSDIAQLLVTTTALYDAPSAVGAAIKAFGRDTVLTASRRLTKAAVPAGVRAAVPDAKEVMARARDEVKHQTGADQIEAETITRFTRTQVIQLVLLIALVYVAYPFISTVPTFFSELRTANWWWALLGLMVSALTYVGAAAALWACADGLVSFRHLSIMQIANTFAATTTPAGVGGLALSTRFLQKGGLSTMRATAAVALQQSVQVIVHVILLIFFSTMAGASADLSHFVPSATILYLIAGLALGLVGAFLAVPKLRRWLASAVRPKLEEVWDDLVKLAREPKRLVLIVLGAAGTTLGAALALWASVEAFGGDTSFVTVTVVTMIGGTLASAAPTPGGVGAVEAALIGGLAAFGVPAAIGVPAVLLYRVLTCWLPVFVGWPVMRWLTKNDMI